MKTAEEIRIRYRVMDDVMKEIDALDGETDSASRDGGCDRTLVTRHCPRGDDVLQNTYPLIGLP